MWVGQVWEKRASVVMNHDYIAEKYCLSYIFVWDSIGLSNCNHIDVLALEATGFGWYNAK